ncbi:MAG TPA: CHAD domain-containing protein [Solirubrobacteraceae bacterium]
MTIAPPKAKISVPLSSELRSDAAVVAVLRALLEVIVANREGVLAGRDPEHLHQLRIAVRRSRTVQRQLGAAFPPLELRGFRSEFRWLQQATGEARDLDVQVEDFDDLRALLPEALRPDLDPLRMILEHWRLAARGATVRTLRSRRTVDLLTDWEMLLETLVELPIADREQATRPIGEFSAQRVRRAYKRLLKLGEGVSADTPAPVLHELRKKGKELRYLLELFAVPLNSAAALEPVIEPLKALQDILGRQQDRVVQIAVLRRVADEVATLPDGAQAVLTMGVLTERLAEDARAARSELNEPLAELGATEQRHIIKRTQV